jgi:hypothetical protein
MAKKKKKKHTQTVTANKSLHSAVTHFINEFSKPNPHSVAVVKITSAGEFHKGEWKKIKKSK